MIAANTNGGSDAGRNVVFTLGFAIDPNAKATLDQFSRMVQQATPNPGGAPFTMPGAPAGTPMWQGQPRFNPGGSYSTYTPPNNRPGVGGLSYEQDMRRIADAEKAATLQFAELRNRLRQTDLQQSRQAIEQINQLEREGLRELARQRAEAWRVEQERREQAESKRLTSERRWNEIVRTERDKQEREAEQIRSRQQRAAERLDNQRQRAHADEQRRYGMLQEDSFRESDRNIASAFRDVQRDQQAQEREQTRRATALQEARDREPRVYRTALREGLEGVNMLARGMTLLTAARGEDLEAMLRQIAVMESVFQTIRGGTQIVQHATQAWEAYTAARGMGANIGMMGRFMGALGPVAAGVGIAAVGIGAVVGYESEQRQQVKDRWKRYSSTIEGLDAERSDFMRSYNERYRDQQHSQRVFEIEGEVVRDRRQRQDLRGPETGLQTAFRDNFNRIARLESEAGNDKELNQALQQQISLQRDVTREKIAQANASKEQAMSMRDISQSLQEQIANSRKSAQERFGDMSAGDQQRLLRIAQRGREGARLTSQERQLLRGSGVDSLVEIANQQSRDAADAAGFNRLAGFTGFAQSAAFGAIAQSSDALQIKIETEIKVKIDEIGEKAVRELEDKMRPVEQRLMDTVMAALFGEQRRFEKRDAEKRANAARQLQGG